MIGKKYKAAKKRRALHVENGGSHFYGAFGYNKLKDGIHFVRLQVEALRRFLPSHGQVPKRGHFYATSE